MAETGTEWQRSTEQPPEKQTYVKHDMVANNYTPRRPRGDGGPESEMHHGPLGLVKA